MRIGILLLMSALLALPGCDGPRERQDGPGQATAEAEATTTAGEYRPPRDLTQVDACALLPPAEIPAQFGKVIEGPTLTRNPNGWPRCWYVLTPNRGLVVELLEAQWYDMNRKVWRTERVEDLKGIGEKAFLVRLEPPSDPHLIAAKGDIAVKVTTRDLELAREAARTVLAKL